MGYGGFKPYVPVARRRAQASRALLKAQQAGAGLAPVSAGARAIATTFWGKAWCDNLQAYSDFASRLPRGRSYLRSGCVIDLQIEPGRVVAQVAGSSLYRIVIGIGALPAPQWQRLVADCTGSIATLVQLLQGRLSEAVMQRMCAPKSGLFPAPEDIQLGCSCPDWAQMCKHVAAVLYGVGVRLDQRPELLFVLRQVDANDLLAAPSVELPARARRSVKAKVLDDADLSAVFGIDLATAETPKPLKKPRSQPPEAAPALAPDGKAGKKSPVKTAIKTPTKKAAKTPAAKAAAGKRKTPVRAA